MPIKTKATQTKPAAAEAPKPEPPQPTRKERRVEKSIQQFDTLRGLTSELACIDSIAFHDLKMFRLIQTRNRGCTTPIEEFIVGLVQTYGHRDDDGLGMTLADVEHEMEDLRSADLTDEISQAHFMASRYPRPEAETADATA